MGGAERQALYLIEHLSKLTGCTVELLTFEDGTVLRPKLEALGVAVHVHPYYFRWKLGVRLKSLARLAIRLRFHIKPDALLPFVGIHSKAIAQVWPYSGARFCWWNQRDEGRDLCGTPEESRVLRKVSCIISNSEAGRTFLAETYGLPRESILLRNNGIAIPAIPKDSGNWRTKLELGERKVVCMIANITRFKDHATLLEAWVLVRRHFRGQALPVLLLAGHQREKETLIHLKLKAFELGLSSGDVKFLGPVEDITGLIAESDLVVHSSLTEGCPNAVCEAMALARAVIATDIPGCRQALGEEGANWLIPPRNPEDLAQKIITLLDQMGLRQQVGQDNRLRIGNEFSIEAMGYFYQECIEAGLGQKIG
jgi:glycosyltransferase involved in cell wall biosynthesis